MGCAFIKLCPEWSGYKTTGGQLSSPALESSPLLNDEHRKHAATNAHPYQKTQCMLTGSIKADDDDNDKEHTTAETDQSLLVEQEQTLKCPVTSAENRHGSHDNDVSGEEIPSASVPCLLTSDYPGTSQEAKPPDILDNTVANGCKDTVITDEQNKNIPAAEMSATCTTGSCHLPYFQIEEVLKEYRVLMEECANLRSRVLAMEAEIELQRTRKSEQLDSLQKQFAEVTSEYNFLQKKSNLLLLASGIPLLVLVFAVLMAIYPGVATPTPS
ncbi:hypothetical protein BsWGS_11349 [Bradybaena similaris]